MAAKVSNISILKEAGTTLRKAMQHTNFGLDDSDAAYQLRS